MEFLEQIDRSLMLFFNGMHSPFFDFVFSNLSKTLVGLPIYLLIIYFVIKQYGAKEGAIVIALLIASVGLADRISVVAFKDVFMRYRPCHNLEIRDQLHMLSDYCGGQYGFVSSHAANVFAVAGFCFFALRQRKTFVIIVLVWAALVAYSRVYLAKHYPADIFAGAILGFLVAWIVYKLYAAIRKKR